MIELRDVTLSFPGKKVIQNLNMRINKGEHVCIAGESGAGKSSVLSLLQGYAQVDSGIIEINKETLCAANVNELRSIMTFIPQNINLPVRSGIDLLTLLECKDKKSNVEQLMEQLGLSNSYLEKAFDEISGGEKQRIVIAVCLSQQKPIVLMDEPTASLDEASIALLIGVLRKIKNTTILSASHNETWQNEADSVIQL